MAAVVFFGPLVFVAWFLAGKRQVHRIFKEQSRQAGKIARLIDLEVDEAECRRRLRERRRHSPVVRPDPGTDRVGRGRADGGTAAESPRYWYGGV